MSKEIFDLSITSLNKENMPEIIKKTNGGDKWNNKIDYSKTENWLAINNFNKEIDVIYFYPTTFNKENFDSPEISDITDEGMRNGAKLTLNTQARVFGEDCNIYAPYYRQVHAPYALSLNKKDANELIRYSASKDPSDALDFYFKNFNNGKPFFLAGHSQGSQILINLLGDYFKKHPEYLSKMIAAYVIGYSVTKQFLKENKHLKFAKCHNDTNVIISYNTEGPLNLGKHNAVVEEGSIAINPLNWKTDETYAGKEENKGSLDLTNKLVDGFADAQVDIKRGTVICKTVDPSLYAIPAMAHDLFGPESYHNNDYGFYFLNLRANIKTRINSFRKR